MNLFNKLLGRNAVGVLLLYPFFMSIIVEFPFDSSNTIAHRLNTLQDYDIIIVLDNGSILIQSIPVPTSSFSFIPQDIVQMGPPSEVLNFAKQALEIE